MLVLLSGREKTIDYCVLIAWASSLVGQVGEGDWGVVALNSCGYIVAGSEAIFNQGGDVVENVLRPTIVGPDEGVLES